MKIVIASKNPVKIKAVETGFRAMFTAADFVIEGIYVESGVADQPMDEAETKRGAINRVTNAQLASPVADFWVGLEGGVQETDEGMETFGWVAIKSEQSIGLSRTASLLLPHKVAELIRSGLELGEADDQVFQKENSKQDLGAVGILTHGVVLRSEGFEMGVKLALVPFVNKELYV